MRRPARSAVLVALVVMALTAAWVPPPPDEVGTRTATDARRLDPADDDRGGTHATCQRRTCVPRVGPKRGITCPPGAVVLRRARTIQKVINRKPRGTTFCFESRTYLLKGPIVPKSRDTFVGKYGAILDGRRWQTGDESLGAFTGTARSISNVTIRNLVIRNMPQFGIATAYGANNGWTIDHNEVSRARVGVAMADQFRVTNNFIHHNGQYGFTGYRATGFVFQDNEVSDNEVCHCHPADGGASKLAGTTDVSLVGNFIHDNGGNGIWFDTDNTGVLVEGNTIAVNGRYAKAISMEQNDGIAIIRNNTIRVGPRGEVGIRLNNSSNVEVYDNTVTTASTSGGGAIHVFFDASRTGYDTTNNVVTNNTIRLRRSATVTAGVTCVNVADCAPYWTTKGNLFQGNKYRVPNLTGAHWALSSAVNWSLWRAAGFDTTGIIISP